MALPYTLTDRDGDRLKVEPSTSYPGEEGFILAADGAYYPATEAPKIALAVLTAAGLDDDASRPDNATPYFTRRAITNLKRAIQAAEKRAAEEAAKAKAEAEAKALAEALAAAEAADRQKLDDEAYALWRAMQPADAEPLAQWEFELIGDVDRWRDVARAARALHVDDTAEADARPVAEVVDRPGDTRGRVLVVHHELGRAWPFPTRESAERCLPLIVERGAGYGVSYPLNQYFPDA